MLETVLIVLGSALITYLAYNHGYKCGYDDAEIKPSAAIEDWNEAKGDKF